jgi:hypothetical protein
MLFLNVIVNIFPFAIILYFLGVLLITGVPPYPQVIRSNTYRRYVKPRIIPNAIYNVIFVLQTQIR